MVTEKLPSPVGVAGKRIHAAAKSVEYSKSITLCAGPKNV
jgi:hypothetical protein